MEKIEQAVEKQEERTLSGADLRDKGDICHAISEGLYLNVFKTDRLAVGSNEGGIYFKF